MGSFTNLRAPCHYRGAAAAVIVFDLTNEESFKKAQSWVKELQRMGNPDMIMSLAGNKADLVEQRAVSTEDAKVKFYIRPEQGN